MKKLLILFAAAALMACGKDATEPVPGPTPKPDPIPAPTSLEGTYWMARTDLEKFWYVETMVFSAAVATYTRTRNDGHLYTFSEPYTYDPLSGELRVRITVEQPSSPPVDDIGIPGFMEGRVNGGVLTLGLWETFDLIQEVTLYKQ